MLNEWIWVKSVASMKDKEESSKRMMIGRKPEGMTESEIDEVGIMNAGIKRPWWGYMSWIIVASIVGFAVSAVFAGILEMDRALYLAIYVPAVLVVLVGYARWADIDIKALFRSNWGWGIVAGLLIGAFSVNSVLMQDGSDMPEGATLVIDLIWLGAVYGVIDALLLSVLPVHAVMKAMESKGLNDSRYGRLSAGILAVIASMFVIGLYHFGYPEFRDAGVFVVMVGVALQSVGYIVTRSPLAPIVSHLAMHVSAVLYGIESVIQLPPHY
jgi:hypothetical protein